MMTRRRTILLSLFAAWWLAGGFVQAEIVVPERADPGTLVELRCEVEAPQGAEVAYGWTVPAGVDMYVIGGGRRVLVTALPGVYPGVQCTVAIHTPVVRKVFVPDPKHPADVSKAKLGTINEAGKLTVTTHAATLVIGDPPPPEPAPEPEPAPPKPGTLAALVPAAGARAQLTEFFTDLATVVRSNAFASTSHFRAGYRRAIADSQAAGKLPTGLAAIDAPIAERLAAAIGLADVALDTSKRDALAVALEAIAAEFKG